MISVCSPSSRLLPGPMSSVLDSALVPSAVEPSVSAPSMRDRSTSFRCADAVVGRCSPRHSVALRRQASLTCTAFRSVVHSGMVSCDLPGSFGGTAWLGEGHCQSPLPS